MGKGGATRPWRCPTPGGGSGGSGRRRPLGKPAPLAGALTSIASHHHATRPSFNPVSARLAPLGKAVRWAQCISAQQNDVNQHSVFCTTFRAASIPGFPVRDPPQALAPARRPFCLRCGAALSRVACRRRVSGSRRQSPGVAAVAAAASAAPAASPPPAQHLMHLSPTTANQLHARTNLQHASVQALPP